MGVFEGFASGLVGGAVSAYGASEQQAESKKMARKSFKRNLYMSNTAHQREVDDLNKAGLNPLLSINKGASSPQAPMPTAQNIAGSGVNSAILASQNAASVRNLEANTAKTIADTNPVNFLESNVESISKILGMPTDKLRGLIGNSAKNIVNMFDKPQGTGEKHTQPITAAEKAMRKKLRLRNENVKPNQAK